MKNTIFILGLAMTFLLLSCGGVDSQENSSEVTTVQEEQIANEVEETSAKAKKEAEETEKEVDKLLEDI